MPARAAPPPLAPHPDDENDEHENDRHHIPAAPNAVSSRSTFSPPTCRLSPKHEHEQENSRYRENEQDDRYEEAYPPFIPPGPRRVLAKAISMGFMTISTRCAPSSTCNTVS
ncbi:hypothetical protein B0H10DRAFT_1371164 [Mycena sp. CBHHK59/15]|nr:hypothetical protein B0H10DRAFT_1371164 [Mycena sp. CBHHK59/15]